MRGWICLIENKGGFFRVDCVKYYLVSHLSMSLIFVFHIKAFEDFSFLVVGSVGSVVPLMLISVFISVFIIIIAIIVVLSKIHIIRLSVFFILRLFHHHMFQVCRLNWRIICHLFHFGIK